VISEFDGPMFTFRDGPAGADVAERRRVKLVVVFFNRMLNGPAGRAV